MLPDDPAELRAGKDYGSEGTAQRYLAALVIGSAEYGYKRSWSPSPRGMRFARRLFEVAFGPPPIGQATFVNEFNLRATAANDNQAVDFAWLSPKHLFMVELKPNGKAIGPGSRVDLLYVTPPMTVAKPNLMPAGTRRAALSWPGLA